MNNQNDYNDNKKITYHEQTDISNIPVSYTHLTLPTKA